MTARPFRQAHRPPSTTLRAARSLARLVATAAVVVALWAYSVLIVALLLAPVSAP